MSTQAPRWNLLPRDCGLLHSILYDLKECQKPNHHYFSQKYRNTPPICIARCLQCVLQCFWCLYALRTWKYCQYASHLYCNTPPICIAVLVEKSWRLWSPGCSPYVICKEMRPAQKKTSPCVVFLETGTEHPIKTEHPNLQSWLLLACYLQMQVALVKNKHNQHANAQPGQEKSLLCRPTPTPLNL